MCQDHQPSRRTFLRGAGVLAGAAALAGRGLPASAGTRPRPRLATRPVDPWGASAYSNAMHIHSSFSEMNGSMDGQLYQAAANAVDVLWWTDHDQRLDWLGYPTEVHFTSLTGETDTEGITKIPWRWKQRSAGSGTGSGGIVTTPCSPKDPVTGGALSLTAKSPTRAPTTFGYNADCTGSDFNYKGTLSGQTWSIDVLLQPGWSHGYLELTAGTSYHPATAGRPAGDYAVSYRIHHGSGPVTTQVQGITGIVKVPAGGPGGGSVTLTPAGGGWVTITVTPAEDIATLWPDMDSRDFASAGITLSAVSTGDQVTGYFDYLRFTRAMSGEVLMSQQADMMAALQPRYPSVTQQQGAEMSLSSGLTHINWFGGSNLQNLSYEVMTSAEWTAYLRNTVVPQIHAGGGRASYNHPYGVGPGLASQAKQDAMLATVAAALLPSSGNPAALGCDTLEVGYVERGLCDLTHHVALLDVLSRNAAFITATGVSDDHHGMDWQVGEGAGNNWITTTWAASTTQADLLAAVAAGRAYCGSLSAPPVALDLLIDSQVPMGAVSVSSLTSRSLTLTAAGLPTGWTVALMQGDVDYAGTNGLASNAAQMGSFGCGDLDGNGQATLTVDTSSASYLRTQIVDSTGTVQALSNPVWLLNTTPPDGIPAPRQA